jgi:hypothetical protein
VSMDFHNRVTARRHVLAGSTAGDAVNVTTVPTLFRGLQAFNLSTGINLYVHIFDSSSLISSGEARKTIPIPAAVSASTNALIGGAVYAPGLGAPILDNGFTYAIGTNPTSSAALSTAAAGLAIVNFDYEPLRGT